MSIFKKLWRTASARLSKNGPMFTFVSDNSSSSTHFDIVISLTQKAWRQCVLILSTILGTLTFFFPMRTDTFSSFKIDQSLSTLDQSFIQFFPAKRQSFVIEVLICTPLQHCIELLIVENRYLVTNLLVVQCQYGSELYGHMFSQFAQTFYNIIGWNLWHCRTASHLISNSWVMSSWGITWGKKG